MGSIPASRAIIQHVLRKALIRKIFQENQPLRSSRLDTTADTLALEADEMFRLTAGLVMKKRWPGYSEDSGRVRFQRRVPEDVRHAFNGKTWIRIPISLPPGQEAKRMAFSWYLVYEAKFAEIRKGEASSGSPEVPLASKPLAAYTAEEMQELVAPVAQRLNRSQHGAIATGAKSFAELTEDHERLDQAVRDVLSGRGSQFLGVLSGLFLASRGIPFDVSHPSFALFQFQSARVLQSTTITAGAQRLRGEYVEPPESVNPRDVLMIKPQGQGAVALTVGAVVNGYLENLPDNHYRRKLVLCLTLFRECVGSATPVAELRQTQVRDFLVTVCRLPRDWGKRFKEKGVSLADLLTEEATEGISEQTYRDNYRATLAKFLNDARRDHGAQGFPMLSADYPYTGTRRGEQDTQRHLEEAELVRLFMGPEFKEIAEDPTQEARYWLPVIALYTGARPREICQLNPQCDWGRVESVWYLSFDETTPAGKGITKSIKTGETRHVPLHPELVRLGLPEYLERMKRQGADRLFPTFRVKGGNPYTVAGADFSDLLRKVGLYDNQTRGANVTGMYVFRKTFATYGDEQGIKVEPFVGHREHGKSITQRHYVTRPKRVPLLFDAFKTLRFGVDIPVRTYVAWDDPSH